MKESIHPVGMILTDGSPLKTNYEPSVKINIGGTVTQVQFKFGTWYPIELAPKDGTKVVLAKFASSQAWPEFGIETTPWQLCWGVVGYWSEKWGNWNDGYEPSGLADPNYFMPLPPPPTNTKGEE